jgi:glycosyltransferase involved in cell wall biosynthesis
LDVAAKVKESQPNWSFHLVGKDFEDDYSKAVYEAIDQKGLTDTVFVYGSKNDVVSIINQCEIAILTSKSEGLPVALIEYGLAKKPVVATNVGEIPLIIKNSSNGFIVGVNEVDAFKDSLLALINSQDLRAQFGKALHQTIQENHSEEGVIAQYLNWIKGL